MIHHVPGGFRHPGSQGSSPRRRRALTHEPWTALDPRLYVTLL